MLELAPACRAAALLLALLAAGVPAPAAAERSRAPRCATPDVHTTATPDLAWDAAQPDTGMAGPADCSLTNNTPLAEYLPSTLLRLPLVVHIIMDNACAQGALTDAQVQSQIDVLREDFRALAGTPGGAGVDTRIQFELATVDPDGSPTTGITRSCNTSWFQDNGTPYWDTLAWDPHRYVNLYTNFANGARGYVPFLPAASGGTMVGTKADRVVINHLAFGRPGPVPTHADGRTATHELGHYLGLYHPYINGCGTATSPGCYTTGDLVCDTPPDANSHSGCPVGQTSCGGVPIPVENYMELTDDTCMTGFTLEQSQRQRCTLRHYRPLLFSESHDRE